MQLRDTGKISIADPRLSWLLRPAAWFWLAMVIGAGIRLYFVVFTEGTYDVAVWQQHAAGIHELGLISYYHSHPNMNHPPFISMAVSLLLRFADTTGIPFRILLRAPFALLDAGTTLLLFRLLRHKPWRFAATACYWLNPLSVIFSAYHGNTDSAVAFSILLCVWLLSRRNTTAAGTALGAGLWIKLPGVLAVPALVMFIQGSRQRFIFLLTTAATALLTYLPVLIQDAGVLWVNVFGYRGLILQTVTGQRVWGPQVLISSFLPSPDKWPVASISIANFLLQHSLPIAVFCVLLLVWLRRSCRSISGVCVTLVASYTLVYGFMNNWAFQYFAWSLPLWFFVRPRFLVPAMILAGGYIYSLYWFLCGNPWLYGNWDFVGRSSWPGVVVDFRNLAVLFFFVSAWVFLISALWAQIAAWLKSSRDNGPSPSQPRADQVG